MKAFNTVLKILAALAAVAGVVYVVAAYGDKIVAWARNLLESCKGKCCCCCNEAVAEATAEDPLQAEETDFEG